MIYIGSAVLDGISLSKTIDRTAKIAEQDQTTRTCRLVLLYTIRKITYGGLRVNSLFHRAFPIYLFIHLFIYLRFLGGNSIFLCRLNTSCFSKTIPISVEMDTSIQKRLF